MSGGSVYHWGYTELQLLHLKKKYWMTISSQNAKIKPKQKKKHHHQV